MSTTGDTKRQVSTGFPARASMDSHAPMLLARRAMRDQRPCSSCHTCSSSGTTTQGRNGSAPPCRWAVLGQVDGHHLPALGVGDLGEPLPLLLVAGLAVEEEAGLVAFWAVTYVWGMNPTFQFLSF